MARRIIEEYFIPACSIQFPNSGRLSRGLAVKRSTQMASQKALNRDKAEEKNSEQRHPLIGK
jgi:hypothetical protein